MGRKNYLLLALLRVKFRENIAGVRRHKIVNNQHVKGRQVLGVKPLKTFRPRHSIKRAHSHAYYEGIQRRYYTEKTVHISKIINRSTKQHSGRPYWMSASQHLTSQILDQSDRENNFSFLVIFSKTAELKRKLCSVSYLKKFALSIDI